MKTCTKCHQERSLELFAKDSRRKDGLQSNCRVCTRARDNAYSKTARGKEIKKRYEQSEKRKAYHKKRNNSESFKKHYREWAESERGREVSRRAVSKFQQSEKGIKARKEYEKSEARKSYLKSEKHKATEARCHHKRRITAKCTLSTLTTEEWELIKKRYKYRCVYCGEKKPLTRDHIIPLSKGGEFTKENIVPACRRCNSRKGNRPVLLQLLVPA
jgi:5-methylcytosine-specific restriction endonuclease McrA